MRPYVPAIAVVGGSGSGKTTLISGVLPSLAGRGRRIVVIKHAAHGFDRRGGPPRDSDRFLEAGAAGVVLVGPETMAAVASGTAASAAERPVEPGTSPLEQALDLAVVAFGRNDLTIVEGFRESHLPKVFVRGGRAKPFSGAVFAPQSYPPGVLAVAAASRPPGLPQAIPVLGPGSSARWAQFFDHLALAGPGGPKPAFSGVILAGGRSTRLGRNKALLDFGGRPLIAHVAARLRPLVEEVVIVAGEADDYRPYADRVVPDVMPGYGPLGGIYSGLLAARHRTVVFMGCDQPLVPADLLERVGSIVAAGADAAVPFAGGEYEPLVAAYARTCHSAVEEAMAAGRRRVVSFYPAVRLSVLAEQSVRALGDPKTLFLNINSEEDYRRALRRRPS
ncbi:MAG TPA: molybdopterin-guanine dinucleotide biosynthesis protein MobB [Bacillota bacterium]|jgi:molybdenum cofactor guanylyltransferase/molybdopterin-guanine dinucleotide biosynthesis protein MobB